MAGEGGEGRLVVAGKLRRAMDRGAEGLYICAMTIGTWLHTRLFGRSVGTDADGNTYYETSRAVAGTRTRRWVIYAGAPEATKVPPEWHSWLHYTTDSPLPVAARRPWQRAHQANATGTEASYRPPGHDYSGGTRARATGDYEAWSPGS